MIATTQTQEVVAVATEKQVQYVFVEDAALIHVGGGSATGHF